MSFAPLFFMLAVVAPPAPPAPPAMVAPPPPFLVGDARQGVTQAIAVQIRQDGALLWNGELHRSSNGSASYNQQQRESRACPASDGRAIPRDIDGLNATSLTLSIDRRYSDPSDDNRVRVNLQRTRPLGTDATCNGGQVSSTIGLSGDTRLIKGQPVSLTGEGGLSIMLTLR